MNPDVSTRVRLLAAQCQDLTQEVRQLAKSEEPTPVVEERIRKALVHVELALEALERKPGATVIVPSFLSRFSGMVDRLSRGSAGRQADARLKLAGSIASLRQAAQSSFKGGIRGSSGTISIPDFLGFLQMQGKTGLMEVNLPRERITIHVSRGDIVEAFSDNSPIGARLGEILVEQGAVDANTLNSFFVYHTRSSGRVGRALEVLELVDERQLRAALSEQVVRMVGRMLQAEDAPFVFHEGRIDGSQVDFRLSVIELLLESARQADEALNSTDPEPPAVLPTDGGEVASDEDPVEEIDLDAQEHLRSQLWNRPE